MKLTKQILLLTSLTMAVPLALPAQAQEIEDIDAIVALVDQDVILRSELDTAVQGIAENIRRSGGNVPPTDLLESQMLERLIVRKLQIQRARQTGIRVSDAEIDQALTLMAQNNNVSVAQLRQVVESDGLNFTEFRRNIAEDIMAERLQQRMINSMDPVSDTEIEILLKSEEFAGGEYNISHILINLSQAATPDEIQDVSKRIFEVHEELRNGMDFTSAAISYSQSQEALDGGQVGWRDLNSVPRAFSDAIKDLKPGEFTAPIRSPAGFHIIKVNDWRERGAIMAQENHARHILIESNQLVSPQDAMEHIRDLRQQILDGADFGELAKEHSDDPTSANIGGDMGWFQRNQFGELVEQMLAGLEVGEVSEPFQSSVGWHIMEKLGFREVDITETALRDRARTSIRQSKQDAEVEAFLRQMREEAFVELRLES